MGFRVSCLKLVENQVESVAYMHGVFSNRKAQALIMSQFVERWHKPQILATPQHVAGDNEGSGQSLGACAFLRTPLQGLAAGSEQGSAAEGRRTRDRIYPNLIGKWLKDSPRPIKIVRKVICSTSYYTLYSEFSISFSIIFSICFLIVLHTLGVQILLLTD